MIPHPHITPMIAKAIADNLRTQCQDLIPPDDPTRADIVKTGRFQDDPVNSNIYLAVCGGDPEDPSYQDGVVGASQNLTTVNAEVGMYFPTREIGGGTLWWRRGIVQVGCYFINEAFDEDTATEYAYAVLARVMANIENTPLDGLTDDQGETAIVLYCYGNTFFETGGPPASYIWRGKVRWACLTERN